MKHAFFILAFLSLTARGELVRENFESARALGMGNAFTAVADDASALWYNPAGLARIRGAHMQLIETELIVDGLDTLRRIGGAVFDGNYNNLIRQGTQTMGFSVRPTFVTKYFGISFFDKIRSFTEFRDLNSLSASVDIFSYNDIGALVAVGFPFGDFLSFGASLRLFQRSGIDETLDTQTLLAQVGVPGPSFQTAIYNYLKTLAAFGWAVGVNAGAMARLPVFGKGGPEWTVSMVTEDVGNTTFRKLGTRTNLPPRLKMSYTLGTAFKYAVGKTSEFTIAGDYRHIFDPIPGIKKLHLGAEYRWRYFDLRAGIYQLYPTFGFGLRFPAHTRLQFSSHAVELGNTALNRSQRIYQLQLTLGFNPL